MVAPFFDHPWKSTRHHQSEKVGRMQRQTLLILFIILLLPDKIFAELAGSPHDFSKENWSAGQICLPCHNVHTDEVHEDTAPLWNRTVRTTSYTVYSSPTFNAVIGQPGGVSKLCLSCHDGTTAIDSTDGVNGSVFISGDARLGTAPGDHHPISFVYDTTLALEDGNLNDPATTASGLGGTIAENLLSDGRVECSSCHDVHNRNDFLPFIDIGGGEDRLCLICHISEPPRGETDGL